MPEISASDAAIIRKQSAPFPVVVNLMPLELIATAEIAVTPVVYPAADIAITNASASWNDSGVGIESQLVRVEKPDGTLAYEGVLRRNVTATHVRLPARNEGDTGIARHFTQTIEAGDIVKIYNTRIPKSMMSRLDEDGVQYKRFDHAFNGETDAPKPIVNMGNTHHRRVDATTGKATFQLSGGGSFSWDGNSLTYTWELPTGVSLVSGTLTDASIMAEAGPGHYVVALRVEDSVTEEPHRGYRYLFATDGATGDAPAFSDRYPLAGIEGDRQTAQGRRMSLVFEIEPDESAAFFTDVYAGAQVHVQEQASFTDDDWHTQETPDAGLVTEYVGYIRSVDVSTTHENIHRVVLHLESPLMYFASLPIAAQHVIEEDPPSNWQRIPTRFAHMAFMVFYMIEYHFPALLQIADMDFGDFHLLKRDAMSVRDGTALDAVTQIMNLRTLANVGCLSSGKILLRRHPWIESNTYRNALDVVWTWKAGDLHPELGYSQDAIMRFGVTEGAAFIYGSGGTTTTLRGWTGGFAQKQGSGKQMLPNDLIATSETDALTVIGNYDQLTNAPTPQIVVDVVGNIDVAEPAMMEPHVLDLSAYDPMPAARSEIFSKTGRMLPTAVTRTWTAGDEGLEKRVEVTLQPETKGARAAVKPQYEIGASPPEPIPEGFIWPSIGDTPSGWAALGTVDTSSWLGDTTQLAGTYTANRVPYDMWKPALARFGVKFVSPTPLNVSRVAGQWFALVSGTVRIAVAVKLNTGVVRVLANDTRTQGAGGAQVIDHTEALNGVKAIYFMAINPSFPTNSPGFNLSAVYIFRDE